MQVTEKFNELVENTLRQNTIFEHTRLRYFVCIIYNWKVIEKMAWEIIKKFRDATGSKTKFYQ